MILKSKSVAHALAENKDYSILCEHGVRWCDKCQNCIKSPCKFNELEYVQELKEYVESTYEQHYAKGIQVTEFIMSHMNTPDFLRGNVLKYTARYGKKDGYNRKDLLKAMHYLILLMHYHDTVFAEKKGLSDSD